MREGVPHGGTGVCTCFVAGAPVAAPRGDVALEALGVGDRVWSVDIVSGQRPPGACGRSTSSSVGRLGLLPVALVVPLRRA